MGHRSITVTSEGSTAHYRGWHMPRVIVGQGCKGVDRVRPTHILYEILFCKSQQSCKVCTNRHSRYLYSGRTSNGLSHYLQGRHCQNWAHPHHGGTRSRPSGNNSMTQYLIPCRRYPNHHDIHGAFLGSQTIIGTSTKSESSATTLGAQGSNQNRKTGYNASPSATPSCPPRRSHATVSDNCI